jgi:membrane associated rhomboid family serine protease
MAVSQSAKIRSGNFGKRVVTAARVEPRPTRSLDDPPARSLAVQPPHPVSRFFSRLPWFTFALSAVLIARFNTELATATDWIGPGAPGHFSLLAMGAAGRDQIIGQGEWWRLFTATMLHGSVSHLAGNLITFLVVGFLLEPMIGIGWFAAIYFLGGIAGAGLSMMLGPPDMLSVGASGAIMATLAALFTLSFRPDAPRPNVMRRTAAGSLFPALIPSVAPSAIKGGGAIVDINAHLGGCMAGAAIAFLMLILWNDEDENPPVRQLAAGAAAVCMAATAWAFMASTTTYVHYAAPGLAYIPPPEMPKDMDSMKADSFSLVEKYPKDPRAHLFRGLYFLEQRDVADAEPYLRDAMRLGENSPVMTRDFADWTRAMLAFSVRALGRPDEARELSAPLCANDGLDERTAQTLKIARLCR